MVREEEVEILLLEDAKNIEGILCGFVCQLDVSSSLQRGRSLS